MRVEETCRTIAWAALLQHASWKRELVLEAVRQNGRVLQWAPKKLRRDHDVVLAAVTQDGSALAFADRFVRNEILADMKRFRMSLIEYASVAASPYIVQLYVTTDLMHCLRGWRHLKCTNLAGDTLLVEHWWESGDNATVDSHLMNLIGDAARRPGRMLRLVLHSVDGVPSLARHPLALGDRVLGRNVRRRAGFVFSRRKVLVGRASRRQSPRGLMKRKNL